MTSRVRFDCSDASGVLITCRDCPGWYEWAWSLADARDRGDRHELDVHANTTAARQRIADRAWRRRVRASET
jgi:hypothetical protein